jgi:hypothetical protein
MDGILRMVATSLLLTLAAALLSAQDMQIPAAPRGPASGCHSHGPATPSPVPTSYECCVNGHHAAVPSAQFSLRFSAPEAGMFDGIDSPGLVLPFSVNSAVLILPSSSPPGTALLRI